MATVSGSGLAFFLFLPVFAILGVLYVAYPRQPRGGARLVADLGALVVAAALSVVAMRAGFAFGAGIGGPIWKQILATLFAYGAFLASLGVALVLRSAWLRRRIG
jgi:predicted MFS family arabinose efflux permease